MTCNQFITTIFTGTGNRRNKDTVFTDALYGLLHLLLKVFSIYTTVYCDVSFRSHFLI